MVELVTYIVEQLVDDKAAVNVTSCEGKQGKIAMAIRTLAKAVGIKNGKRYSIEIAD